MSKKRTQITGYYARQASSKVLRLLLELQIDVLSLMLAAGLNDQKKLEQSGTAIMAKLQACIKHIRAALEGNYEGLDFEAGGVKEKP